MNISPSLTQVFSQDFAKQKNFFYSILNFYLETQQGLEKF